MKIVKGWKNTDKNLMCRDFQFKVGKKYHQERDIKLCGNGFHFHENRFDIFQYYKKDDSLVVEIEASGKVITGDDKSVCSDIKIIKILTDDEVNELCNLVSNTGLHNTGDSNTGDSNAGDWNTGNSNTGDWNTGNSNTGYSNAGDWNTGNSNTGDWNTGYSNTGYSNTGNSNTGDWNTGYSNTGYSNTGDWNTSDYNTGYFNTKEIKTINVFNKPCDKKMWDKAIKPTFIYFNLTFWIPDSEMTKQEKIDHKSFHCQKGFLKGLSYKEAWQKAWDNKQEGDVEKLEALPNFDWKVFTEISGIEKP